MVLLRTEPYEMRKYEDVFCRFKFSNQKVWPGYCGEYTIGWYWLMKQKLWEWSKRWDVAMWREETCHLMKIFVYCMALYHDVDLDLCHASSFCSHFMFEAI
jgi:hypothetical protein